MLANVEVVAITAETRQPADDGLKRASKEVGTALESRGLAEQ